MEEDDESHDHSNFAQSRQPLEENLDFSSGPSSACSDSLSDKEAEEVVNQTSTTLDLDENYDDNDFSLIQNYTLKTRETDYYSLLGLSKSPSPSDAQIRSAYRTLTLSFHPDKQPSGSRSRQVAAEQYFETIREAYETLIDPKKRLVYDLLGVDGVKREWGKGGLMRSADTARHARQNGGTMSSRGTRNGRRAVSDDGSEEEVPSPTPKEAGMELGVKSMNPEEFRKWFLESMKARERKVLDEMVAGKVHLSFRVSFFFSRFSLLIHIHSLEKGKYIPWPGCFFLVVYWNHVTFQIFDWLQLQNPSSFIFTMRYRRRRSPNCR
jgi:curved DNA-binding protein CbpA